MSWFAYLIDMVLMINENILKANILKVAHHGSKSSSSEEFLERVSPDIAIIGVGKNNKYYYWVYFLILLNYHLAIIYLYKYLFLFLIFFLLLLKLYYYFCFLLFSINNILKYKTEIYRTDKDGEIKVKTDGIRIIEVITNRENK